MICKARATLGDDIWEKKSLQTLLWLLFAVVFPDTVPEYVLLSEMGGTTLLELMVQEQILCALFFLHP